MGKFFDTIPDFVVRQIENQHMFWVATAPLSAEGHVNVSSKGLEGTFHVVDDRTVWYEDLTGSGESRSSGVVEMVVLRHGVRKRNYFASEGTGKRQDYGLLQRI